jgi:glucose-1-phosphate thymidylyltransferase
MKGIVLAGGLGSRLYPSTKVISKQLLPVYDKPMIYYSLSVLMLAKIREILIISTPKDMQKYEELLGDGGALGIKIEYKIQRSPNGLAEAFILGEEFIGSDNVCLILGDNIFYGQGFSEILKESSSLKNGGIVYAYKISDPKRFGVIEFDQDLNIKSIEEKPNNPKSDYAITGIYFYDNKVVEISKNLKPSNRGELEITSVNQEYLKKGLLKTRILGRGFAWLDTGTAESLSDASQFVQTIEKRQGYKIGCIEEIAYNNKWINKDQFLRLIQSIYSSDYKEYLIKVFNNKN